MISVSEADQILLEEHFDPAVASVRINDAIGRVLAEDIRADRDLPPFNRATMDGIAIASASFRNGNREYIVKGIQAAGIPPMSIGSPSQCIEIMTGAVVPDSTDAVVRYEDITIQDGKASIKLDELFPFQNIHQQGKDALRGALLLRPSQKLSPAEISVMASVGYTTVKVYEPPRVAVVSTGDELVPVEARPQPWQVRTSNSHAIAAALNEMGIRSTMHHVTDDEPAIQKNLSEILDEHDVVILSGGVSKGKYDYVPSALIHYGIKQKFHEVSQRPGKPLWFGQGKNKTVFALPGNPVSTFMCFHRYAKQWLERTMFQTVRQQSAVLTRNFQFKAPLTYYLQVSVEFQDGRLMATPDAGGGSGDFANLINVDGFLELPLEQSDFKAGEVFPYHPFRTRS
jgi:molybdopterin molybdotransferase